MMTLTLLLALQDCDAMHGVGCIYKHAACASCKAATDFEARRCDACASKVKALLFRSGTWTWDGAEVKVLE